MADGLGLRGSQVQFIELPTVPYAANPDWVSWPPAATRLFGAIARDQVLARRRVTQAGAGHSAGHRRAAGHRHAAGHGAAVMLPAVPAATASAGPDRSHGSRDRLARQYGGITGSANVCDDAGAFAGPRGGR